MMETFLLPQALALSLLPVAARLASGFARSWRAHPVVFRILVPLALAVGASVLLRVVDASLVWP